MKDLTPKFFGRISYGRRDNSSGFPKTYRLPVDIDFNFESGILVITGKSFTESNPLYGEKRRSKDPSSDLRIEIEGGWRDGKYGLVPDSAEGNIATLANMLNQELFERYKEAKRDLAEAKKLISKNSS